MTLKEFIDKNGDILIRPITEDEFKKLQVGDVVFIISTSVGQKPIEERIVKVVSYHMVCHRSYDSRSGSLAGVTTMGITKGGNIKTEYTNMYMHYHGDSNRLIYHCKSLPIGDPREKHNWDL
jgi:hypothetical protein